MIVSFEHKGLERFFTKGTKAGINPAHAEKLSLILARLNGAADLQDMHYPGSGLHGLRGKPEGYSSVTVSGNWRIIFKFENGDAYIVDYPDYH